LKKCKDLNPNGTNTSNDECNESKEINERRDGNKTNFVKELNKENRNIDSFENVEKNSKEGKSIILRLKKALLSKRKAASQGMKKDKKGTRTSSAYDPPDVKSSVAVT